MINPSKLRIIDKSASTQATPKIKHGEVIQAKVVGRIATDRFVLMVKSQRITVRSDAPLKTGTTILVRADWQRNTLFLLKEGEAKYAPRSEGARAIEDPPFRSDVKDKAAVAALMRSGMAVTSESINTLVRTAAKRSGRESYLSRLLAILLDKNIEPTDSYLDALFESFDLSDKRRQRRNERQKQPDCSEEEQFARKVKTQADPGDGESSALQLFNHIKARRDDWQIVPFEVERGDWDAGGVIRIRRGIDGSIRSFVLQMRAGADDHTFVVEYAADRCVATVPQIGGKHRNDARKILSEKLRNMGIDIDDTKIDDTFDGFSGELTIENGAVDTTV